MLRRTFEDNAGYIYRVFPGSRVCWIMPPW